MIYTPMTRGDIYRIKPQQRQASEWEEGLEDIVQLPESFVACYGRTFWEDSNPVALAGIVPAKDNFYFEGWTVLGEEVLKNPFGFLRAYKLMLDSEFENFNMRRLEVTGRVDHPGIQKWMRFCGFREEGTMRRYCQDGTDAWLFARVREDDDGPGDAA